jgi:hypothetical protein
VEWNILPAFFGFYELQVERRLNAPVGVRAAFGVFDGLFEGKTMTSDYEAFGGSLGLRWYPSSSKTGFFLEGDVRADRLSWILTFFPPTEPPGGSFPDHQGPFHGAAAPATSQQSLSQPTGPPEPTETSDWSSSFESLVGYRFLKGRFMLALSAGVGITLLAPDAEKGGEPPIWVRDSESYQDFLKDFNGRYDTLEPRGGVSVGIVFR